MRVLVVDDEVTSRIALKAIAKRAGFVADAASDGEQAWALLAREAYPIVITDWIMPHIDGIELTRRIRAKREDEGPELGYTYVLVVTALSAREKVLEAFNSGADDLLVKPIDAEQVTARLSAARRIVRDRAAAAETALRNTIGTLQSFVGPDSPALLPSLGALVDLCRSNDALAKARAFLRRQIDISMHSLGADHEHVVRLRQELAEIGEAAPQEAGQSSLTPPSR